MTDKQDNLSTALAAALHDAECNEGAECWLFDADDPAFGPAKVLHRHDHVGRAGVVLTTLAAQPLSSLAEALPVVGEVVQALDLATRMRQAGHEAHAATEAECERLRTALERIAQSGCTWQVDHDECTCCGCISRRALPGGET